jgi:hypothetical protein
MRLGASGSEWSGAAGVEGSAGVLLDLWWTTLVAPVEVEREALISACGLLRRCCARPLEAFRSRTTILKRRRNVRFEIATFVNWTSLLNSCLALATRYTPSYWVRRSC